MHYYLIISEHAHRDEVAKSRINDNTHAIFDEMSANINQVLMSCFSVILSDFCKTRGRLFNKHHILSINNHPFPGTRSHFLYPPENFRKHRKHNVNNMLGLTCIAQNKPLTVIKNTPKRPIWRLYVIMRYDKITFLTH